MRRAIESKWKRMEDLRIESPSDNLDCAFVVDLSRWCLFFSYSRSFFWKDALSSVLRWMLFQDEHTDKGKKNGNAEMKMQIMQQIGCFLWGFVLFSEFFFDGFRLRLGWSVSELMILLRMVQNVVERFFDSQHLRSSKDLETIQYQALTKEYGDGGHYIILVLPRCQTAGVVLGWLATSIPRDRGSSNTGSSKPSISPILWSALFHLLLVFAEVPRKVSRVGKISSTMTFLRSPWGCHKLG